LQRFFIFLSWFKLGGNRVVRVRLWFNEVTTHNSGYVPRVPVGIPGVSALLVVLRVIYPRVRNKWCHI
jgi:hypothetical protein